MSQIIENLNFFIMEKFYLVELFTFTKFQHHLSHILMNRHISLKYLYSISLTPDTSRGLLPPRDPRCSYLLSDFRASRSARGATVAQKEAARYANLHKRKFIALKAVYRNF